jgi:hypothetical protein
MMDAFLYWQMYITVASGNRSPIIIRSVSNEDNLWPACNVFGLIGDPEWEIPDDFFLAADGFEADS